MPPPLKVASFALMWSIVSASAAPINWNELQQIDPSSEERELVFDYESTLPRRFFRVVVDSVPSEFEESGWQ